MCVYCKDAPACDHERDACAASRGERCPECGHGSSAFPPYTPGRKRFNWPPEGLWSKRKPLTKSTQAMAPKRRAKKTP
jgi:hypothetical protein